MRMSKLITLIKGLLRRSSIEAEMNDELQFHIEARADDLQNRQGLSRAEAIRRARVEFGSMEKYREEGRASRGFRFVDEISADVRYAVRQFRATPLFFAVTVLTLAIGIGANVTAFTRINEALWKPLPVPHPEQLLQLQWASPRATFRTNGNSYSARQKGYSTSFSYPAYVYLRDRSKAFADLFCFDSPQNMNLGTQGRAESAVTIALSGNYFRAPGIDAIEGRAFTPEDDAPNATPVVVLNYGFWERAFGRDPNAVGRTVTLNRSE